MPGWSPEVAVVLWRRILGCLGNVNNIRDVNIHEEVYEYLCDLVKTLVKVGRTDLVKTLVKVILSDLTHAASDNPVWSLTLVLH